jgi:hypothetical protein
VVQIPVYNGLVKVTCDFTSTLIYLYPGENFWFVVEGNARYVNNAFSWLDSENGVAWTGFQTSSLAAPAELKKRDVNESVVGWIVERTLKAASTALVLVS